MNRTNATLDQVRWVHDLYLRTGLPPRHEDPSPEPEDVWRLDRDLRLALDGNYVEDDSE